MYQAPDTYMPYGPNLPQRPCPSCPSPDRYPRQPSWGYAPPPQRLYTADELVYFLGQRGGLCPAYPSAPYSAPAAAGPALFRGQSIVNRRLPDPVTDKNEEASTRSSIASIVDRLTALESKLGSASSSTDVEALRRSIDEQKERLDRKEAALSNLEAELKRQASQLDAKAMTVQKLSSELSQRAADLEKASPASAGSNAEKDAVIKSQTSIINEWQTVWSVVNDIFSKFYGICSMTIPNIPEHTFSEKDPMTLINAMQNLIKGFTSMVIGGLGKGGEENDTEDVGNDEQDDPEKLD